MKSVFGLDENVVAALSNATFGLFGVVALAKEPSNKFVRFHGMQSIITFFGLAVISGIVSFLGGILGKIPLLGWLLGMPFGVIHFTLGLFTAAAWIYLSYTAYKGRMVKVPLIGDAVEGQLNKAPK